MRPVYIHLPPIMKNSKEKLSKRNGDASYQDFVDKGYVKECIVNYIALLGWSPKGNEEKLSLAELEQMFSLDGISKSPSIFDEVKMRWLSGEYIKAMTDEEFLQKAMPFFEKSKVYGQFDLLKIASLLKTRVEIYSQIPEKIDFLAEFGEFDKSLYFHKKMKTDEDIARLVLPRAREVLANLSDFTAEQIHDSLIALATEMELKNGQVLWCVRVALTGQPTTPGGAVEMADILGKERTLQRMDASIAMLQ